MYTLPAVPPPLPHPWGRSLPWVHIGWLPCFADGELHQEYPFAPPLGATWVCRGVIIAWCKVALVVRLGSVF